MKITDLIYQLRYVYYTKGDLDVMVVDKALDAKPLESVATCDMKIGDQIKTVAFVMDAFAARRAASEHDRKKLVNMNKDADDNKVVDLFSKKPVLI